MKENPNPYASPAPVAQEPRKATGIAEEFEASHSVFASYVMGFTAVFLLLTGLLVLRTDPSGNAISLTLSIVFALLQFVSAGYLFCLVLTKQVYDSVGISTWFGFWRIRNLNWHEIESWRPMSENAIIELRAYGGRRRLLNPLGSKETYNMIVNMLKQVVGQPNSIS